MTEALAAISTEDIDALERAGSIDSATAAKMRAVREMGGGAAAAPRAEPSFAEQALRSLSPFLTAESTQERRDVLNRAVDPRGEITRNEGGPAISQSERGPAMPPSFMRERAGEALPGENPPPPQDPLAFSMEGQAPGVEGGSARQALSDVFFPQATTMRGREQAAQNQQAALSDPQDVMAGRMSAAQGTPAAEPLPGVGAALPPGEETAPSGGGTGAEAPAEPRRSGEEVFRDQLARVRDTGVSDDSIRAGVEQGVLPPELGQALDAEEEARRRLREQQREATLREEAALQGTQDALTELQAEQEHEQRELNRKITAEMTQLEQLQEEQQALEVSDPWADKSTGQQIAAGIAIILGGLGAGLTGGPNMGLEAVERAIDRDLAIQQKQIENKARQVGQQRSLLGALRSRLGDMRLAQSAAKDLMLQQAEIQIKQMASRTKRQEAQAQADIALAQIAQKRAEVQEQYRQRAEERAREEQARQRVQAASQAVVSLQGDPQAQREALAASGDPELAGAAIESAMSGGVPEAQSPLGKLMADFGIDRTTPQAREVALAAINNELQANGISINRWVAQIAEQIEETGTVTDRQMGALQVLQGFQGSPRDILMGGIPQFSLGQAVQRGGVRVVPGGLTDTPQAPAEGQEARQQAVQPQQQGELPEGMSEEQALQQARQAIENGKSRAAVEKRLRSFGVDPSKLDQPATASF